MDYRILGPLEVCDSGRQVGLGGDKQRALLAILLLRRNEVVSADRLVDDLWGESPPPSALRTLQAYVSRLRKALATDSPVSAPERDPSVGADEGALVTRGHGYLLRVAPGELDLDRFNELVEEGRNALADGDPWEAARVLREGLGLWRGPPLADLAYEPFAQIAIAEFEELRLGAIEERVEADLARGLDRELVSELRALVERHPLRERLRGQLMLSLYRSSRQAEALEVYQDFRRNLSAQLGLDPGPGLQQLELAILGRDPSLLAQPANRAAGERTPSPVVGADPSIASEPRRTGIQTFMIGDIRGYTRFTEEHGDQAAARLTARFSEIAADVLESSGGTVVEFRGDEVLAVFESARSAIAAGIELQRRLADATFADESLPLPVGIGLDAGEAVAIPEGYRGGALNLAARLCGLAAAGEILASQEFVHLAGRIPEVVYEDRDPVEVKNLSKPVAVVRIAPAGDDPAERFTGWRTEPSQPRKLRVALADDSVLVREVLVRVLTDAGYEIISQSVDGEGLEAEVRRHRPDVVVTDIRMPPTHTTEGLKAAVSIRADFPEVAVLVLSQYIEVRHALDLLEESPAGVGYLLKDRLTDMSELDDALRRIIAGGTVVDPEVIAKLLRRSRHGNPLDALDEEEQEILALMAEGLSNDDISDRSSLVPAVVETHVNEIFRKLGLETGPSDHRRVVAVLTYLRGR